MEVRGQLGMAVVVIALDRGLLDRPVHALDLAVGPWMLHFGQAMLDAMSVAEPIEDMGEGVFVVRHIGELDAIIGKHGMDGVRDRFDQVAQELGGDHLAGFLVQFDKSELACPIDRDEQAQLALGGLHFGDVDVEVADRIGLELPLRLLSPVTSGNRLIPCRCRQRCRDEVSVR